MTALVPSEIACLESSPLNAKSARRCEEAEQDTYGRMSRTEVWISREEMVDRWLYEASLEASVAIRSKMSETKELRIDMALLLSSQSVCAKSKCGKVNTNEIPVSGWTCLRTL